jgi:hypothetical protein
MTDGLGKAVVSTGELGGALLVSLLALLARPSQVRDRRGVLLAPRPLRALAVSPSAGGTGS